ncbi:MAG: CinA family nicotinamide mononucleotide deamidase-related protein [Desulfobacteraceae bacterium]|nr:MAG: CinA family nicotinamide mononucleotide deamidase-related protein [Desulfobacteraceae bacterium]
MKAQILSTGDELILGHIADTNGAFLARRLTDMGVSVEKIMIVGDDAEDLARILDTLSTQTDIVLITGGLGPTGDDRTAAAAAEAFNVPLALNPGAMETMRQYFSRRGFEFTHSNEKQAWLPSGAHVIQNEWGTAPGFSIEYNRCRYYFMPGVPSEMTQMFEFGVKPDIEARFNIKGQIWVDKVCVFGLGESRVGELLEGFEETFDSMRLSFRAVFPVIEVKIICMCDADLSGDDIGSARDMQEIENKLETAKQWVVSRLENRVYSVHGLTLAQELGRILSKKQLTLAVAESCTGGLISHAVTEVAGSSDYFLLSATTYANSAKTGVLGVQEKTLVDHGAVHENTALEMANGIRRISGADVAVSTTGIAGPGGGTEEKPVGTVCIAAVGPGFETVKRYQLDIGDRGKNKQLFAATAMNLLIRQIRRNC